jgi:hypothetical protein
MRIKKPSLEVVLQFVGWMLICIALRNHGFTVGQYIMFAIGESLWITTFVITERERKTE